MRAGEQALEIADADPAADRILDAHDAIAQLVQPARAVEGGAVSDVLTVDVLRAAPLAVPVPVEPEVEARAEVEAGVRQGGDRDVARGAVAHRCVQHTSPEPAVRRIDLE